MINFNRNYKLENFEVYSIIIIFPSKLREQIKKINITHYSWFIEISHASWFPKTWKLKDVKAARVFLFNYEIF